MRVSEAVLVRVRDYAVAEPSFTCAFAAWDLSRTGEPITATPVRWAVEVLLAKGVVALVEDHGRAGKVYAYVPPTSNGVPPQRRPALPELDAGVGLGAPQRGVVVPHTRAEGPSDRPGRTRKRQQRGVRVKRPRMGT